MRSEFFVKKHDGFNSYDGKKSLVGPIEKNISRLYNNLLYFFVKVPVFDFGNAVLETIFTHTTSTADFY